MNAQLALGFNGLAQGLQLLAGGFAHRAGWGVQGVLRRGRSEHGKGGGGNGKRCFVHAASVRKPGATFNDVAGKGPGNQVSSTSAISSHPALPSRPLKALATLPLRPTKNDTGYSRRVPKVSA